MNPGTESRPQGLAEDIGALHALVHRYEGELGERDAVIATGRSRAGRGVASPSPGQAALRRLRSAAPPRVGRRPPRDPVSPKARSARGKRLVKCVIP